MDKVAELLREREVRGLILATWTRLVLMLIVFVVQLATAYRLADALAAIVPLMAALACVLLLRRLRRRESVELAGYCGVAFDLLLVAALPQVWYASIGYSTVAASLLLKANSWILAALVLIVLNGLAFRPRYPLIMAAGASLLHIALAAWMFSDPRSEYTRDWGASIMGPQFNLNHLLVDHLVIWIVGVIVALMAELARRTVREAVVLQKANSQLSRYFSPNVAADIAGADDAFLKPGGRLQEVVVMFCDIRGFTPLSAGMSPDQAVAFLSDYQARMVAEIFRHGGTLDKFIGDGIMATFGTPEPAADDADRAIACGLAMKRALATLNAERAALGLAAIAQGIGIHAGPAIVGNVGTPDRLEYTVIGGTVNLANRIEQACKITGESFLISEAVRARLRRPTPLRELPAVTLDGVAAAPKLFAVAS